MSEEQYSQDLLEGPVDECTSEEDEIARESDEFRSVWIQPEPIAKRYRLDEHGRALILPAAGVPTRPALETSEHVLAQANGGAKAGPALPAKQRDSDLKRKKPSWRLRTVKLYLTYPKCGTAPTAVLENIKARFKEDLQWAVVGQEKHQDGSLHLHAAVRLFAEYSSRNARDLDALTGTHGNYQVMRREPECVGYCIKDGNFVAHGIDPKVFVEQASSKKTTKLALVAKAIQDGCDLESVNGAFPSVVLQHKRKVEEYISLIETFKVSKALKPWVPPKPEDYSQFHDRAIAIWLADNINDPQRPLRKKQLWITAPTRAGKSTLIHNLRKMLVVYTAPLEEKFYDNFDDKRTQLVVFEEFTNNMKSSSFMLAFTGGDYMEIGKKGAQITKTKAHPVIVLSNRTMEECYEFYRQNQPAVFQALKDRFHCLVLSKDAKINVFYEPDNMVHKDALADFVKENAIDLDQEL